MDERLEKYFNRAERADTIFYSSLLVMMVGIVGSLALGARVNPWFGLGAVGFPIAEAGLALGLASWRDGKL